MGIDKAEDVRQNGKFYTPEILADFLASPLITNETRSVFDPSYGDGALLLAAQRVSCQKDRRSNLEFYGCDNSPVNGFLKSIPKAHLAKKDFFQYNPKEKFDVILMNPPYVRHHLISNETRLAYQDVIDKTLKLDSTSDLWTYFLVKAVLHLEESGCLGAILPWSFLQAEYAQKVRNWVAHNFAKITVHALSAKYFDNCLERVVLVWLKNFNGHLRKVAVGYSEKVTPKVKYHRIEKKAWVLPKVVAIGNYDIEAILQKYIDQFGFSRFKEFAEVQIGVVTGADDFFIVSKKKAKELGFPNKHLVPILKSSIELTGLFMNDNKPENMLLVFPKNNLAEIRRHIQSGIKNGYHLRSHSARRNPWFYVNPGEAPDAFFHYRCSHTPYLMTNNYKIQCTNSIHRIYFKGLNENQIKWVQLTLLSVPGQLSLEAYSRVYGSGVLKIEPSSLKNAIAHKGNKKFPSKVYQKVSDLIEKKNRELATELATEVIDEALGVPSALSKDAKKALIELQNSRK